MDTSQIFTKMYYETNWIKRKEEKQQNNVWKRIFTNKKWFLCNFTCNLLKFFSDQVNVKYVRFQGLMILINMNNETYLSSDGSWIMYPRIVDTMLCNLPCMNSFFTYRLMTPLFTLLILLLQFTIKAWNIP